MDCRISAIQAVNGSDIQSLIRNRGSPSGLYSNLTSLHIAETSLRTVRSSAAGKSSRLANRSIISRTGSLWLVGMP